MDTNVATWWWVGAGLLVAVELATGTFYLLMIALGMVAGAVAAHAGLAGSWQLVAAALVGGVATAAWHAHRVRQPRSAPAQANRDVNLDIGETVDVAAWAPDGSAQVLYRGARWTVRYRGDGEPRPGPHVIVALDGNRLLVAPRG